MKKKIQLKKSLFDLPVTKDNAVSTPCDLTVRSWKGFHAFYIVCVTTKAFVAIKKQ